MRRVFAPWWVVPCAAAFLAFFLLLLYCDIWRPEAEGLQVKGSAGVNGLLVEAVERGSPAEKAGVRPGDVVISANGRPLSSKLDLEEVESVVRFDSSFDVEVLRDGRVQRFEWIVTREGWDYWLAREGYELLLTRLVQFVTLVLGLFIVFKRPGDFGARIGGWLLATFGVFYIDSPYRFFDVWRALWWPAGVVLWLPLLSYLLLPGLLLTFFLDFPRRVLHSTAAWVAIWAPVLAIGLRQAWFHLNVVYGAGSDRLPDKWAGIRFGVAMGYLVAAAVVALVRYRRADATERRRLAVMALGGGPGAVGGGIIVFGYWRATETGVFASPWVALGALLLLVVPLSFTYAILRHRLFDVTLIIRQGVRYALARRLLLSIVPALAAMMVIDAYLHRDRAIEVQFVERAPIYGLLSVLAIVAAYRRQRWLDGLDKRFFRERYDARRLLHEVVEDVRHSPGLPEAAPLVVDQIARALHPTFVTLLAQQAEGETYQVMAAAPPSAGPADLPAGSKLVALARLLSEPLDLSAAGDGWLASRLSPAETAVVERLGLEMVVAIDPGRGRPAALLVLGARRSEEPYAEEDGQLLFTIAQSLAVLYGRERRDPSSETVFAECGRCGTCYDHGTAVCPLDASPLTPVALPRVLSRRYRFERKLGHGGMGVVYAASDLSLGRAVAVKVLREELVHDVESAGRFEREARMSAMFTHPNVVTVHDFGVVSGSRAFLVMELLEGSSLRDEIDRGPMSSARVLEIMRGVCAAVEAAHRRQLVHRDLKPENVFLVRGDFGETPKVLDFGIAKVLSDRASTLQRETGIGAMVGTPRYMAPEQLRGGSPDPSWDIWALALVAYEMLTGAHPFAALALGLPGAEPGASPALAGDDGRLPPAWRPTSPGGSQSTRWDDRPTRAGCSTNSRRCWSRSEMTDQSDAPSADARDRRRFATTRWSQVLAAGRADTRGSREALSRLCESYWYPLYVYVRRWGYDADQAQDLTQEFFTRLLEKHYLQAADPSRGRFRSFLLASLKHFLANERDRAGAIKRGGRTTVVPLEIENAEGRYSLEPPDDETPEKIYERRWALTLLERTLARLSREFEAAGKRPLFVRLEGYLTGEQETLPYAELASELGMSEGAVKVMIHRLRRRFGALLREEVGETVSTPEEVDDEIRELFRVLKGE